VTSSFEYNQHITDPAIPQSTRNGNYDFRQWQVLQAIELVIEMLTLSENQLLENQAESEIAQLKFFLKKDTYASKSEILATIRDRHERAIAKCAKQLNELRALQKHFAGTHCTDITDEELEHILSIFKGVIIGLIQSVAYHQFPVVEKHQDNVDFSGVETELCHIIVYARACTVIGKRSDPVSIMQVYPFNVWD